MSEEPMVSYPLTEMLRRIDDKIDRLFTMLSTKADQAAVDRLTRRVDGHDEHIRVLLDERQGRVEAHQSRTEWRRWVIPTIISAAATVAMIMTVLRP